MNQLFLRWIIELQKTYNVALLFSSVFFLVADSDKDNAGEQYSQGRS